MRTFILVEEGFLFPEPTLHGDGFLTWRQVWHGVVFFYALNLREAWKDVKAMVPLWYDHAFDITFDRRLKRIVLDLPIRGEVVLVMREVK